MKTSLELPRTRLLLISCLTVLTISTIKIDVERLKEYAHIVVAYQNCLALVSRRLNRFQFSHRQRIDINSALLTTLSVHIRSQIHRHGIVVYQKFLTFLRCLIYDNTVSIYL